MDRSSLRRSGLSPVQPSARRVPSGALPSRALLATALGLPLVAAFCGPTAVGSGAHVAARGDFTCVLASTGTVQCCGNGWEGQLGNGAREDEGRLVSVSGLDDATSLSVGSSYACAVRKDGTVWCWGEGRFGQLGYVGATQDMRSRPHPTSPLNGVATQVSAGILHTCARLADGTARCWGAGLKGQLGNGKLAESNDDPMPVVGLTHVAEIAVGDFSTCARLDDGSVRCWGANEYGQLGDGTTEDRREPTPVVGVRSAIALSVGEAYACALIAGGDVLCWGGGSKGAKPSPAEGVNHAVQVVASGQGVGCARLEGGATRCWNTAGPGAHLPLPPESGPVTDLAIGGGHGCVLANGKLVCAGNDGHGQLCRGSSPPRSGTFPPPG